MLHLSTINLFINFLTVFYANKIIWFHFISRIGFVWNRLNLLWKSFLYPNLLVNLTMQNCFIWRECSCNGFDGLRKIPTEIWNWKYCTEFEITLYNNLNNMIFFQIGYFFEIINRFFLYQTQIDKNETK